MSEKGYDLNTHASKGLDDIPKDGYDHVVTMGCGDECPWIPARNRADWDIPDPKHMEPNEFGGVRDLIEKKVLELLG